MLNYQWIYDDFHGDSITKIDDIYGTIYEASWVFMVIFMETIY